MGTFYKYWARCSQPCEFMSIPKTASHSARGTGEETVRAETNCLENRRRLSELQFSPRRLIEASTLAPDEKSFTFA